MNIIYVMRLCVYKILILNNDKISYTFRSNIIKEKDLDLKTLGLYN